MILAAEDLEAGTRKKTIQAEPTLPIYLKVTYEQRLLIFLSFFLKYRANMYPGDKLVFPKNAWIDFNTVYLDRKGWRFM